MTPARLFTDLARSAGAATRTCSTDCSHRQALRRRPDERPSIDDPVAGRQRAGAAGSLVSGYRGRQCGRRFLFGKVDPSGKLPMSFPVNVGQVPISYNELPTGRPYDPTNKYTSQVSRRAEHAAVPVRLRPLLHDVLVLRADAPASVSRKGTFHVTADDHEQRLRRRYGCRPALPA